MEDSGQMYMSVGRDVPKEDVERLLAAEREDALAELEAKVISLREDLETHEKANRRGPVLQKPSPRKAKRRAVREARRKNW